MTKFEGYKVGDVLDIGDNPFTPKLKIDDKTCVDLIDGEKVKAKFNKFCIIKMTLKQASYNLGLTEDQLKTKISHHVNK